MRSHTPPLHPRSASAEPPPNTQPSASPEQAVEQAVEEQPSHSHGQEQLAAAAGTELAAMQHGPSPQPLHEGGSHIEVAAPGVPGGCTSTDGDANDAHIEAAPAQETGVIGAASLVSAGAGAGEDEGYCSSVPGSPTFDDSFAAEAQLILGSLVTPAPARANPLTPFLSHLAASPGVPAAAAAAAEEEVLQVQLFPPTYMAWQVT